MSLFAEIKQRFDTYQPLRDLGLPELRTFEAKEGDASVLPYMVMIPTASARQEAGTDSVYTVQDLQFTAFHKSLEVLERISEEMKECFPDRVDLPLPGKSRVLSMRLTSEVFGQDSRRVYRLDMDYEILMSRPRA